MVNFCFRRVVVAVDSEVEPAADSAEAPEAVSEVDLGEVSVAESFE